MYLGELIERQEQMHDDIMAYKGIEQVDLFGSTKNAFRAELSELAEELGFFRYWDDTEKGDRSTQLYEYVDGLSFLLELAIITGLSENLKSYPIQYADGVAETAEDLNVIFEKLYTNKFENDFDLTYAISLFLTLGVMIGYSEKEIATAFFDKKEIVEARRMQA